MIISWGNFIRRSSSIAEIVDLQDVQIKPIFKILGLKPINYCLAWLKCLWLILRSRKKLNVVVLVTPPNFTLYLVPIIKLLVRDCKIIADCHNGTFSKKWLSIPFVRHLLKLCDEVLIHNEDFYAQIIGEPVLHDIAVKVLPDPPSIPKSNSDKKIKTNKIVFPASYAKDEPIEELLQLMESDEFKSLECMFYLTGPSYKLSPDQMNRFKSLNNVELTGFLDLSEYELLLHNAIAVLCLTKFEGIQLCAINEAIGFSCVPIYSKTKTLATIYGDLGIPVKKDLSNLYSSICSVLNNPNEYEETVNVQRIKRLRDWQERHAKTFINKP